MAYGDYDGPDRALKGKKHGNCNRRSCQAAGAIWYNHGSYAWYCESCRDQIEFDKFNHMNWQREWLPKCGHPMFETQAMMNERKASTDAIT